MTATATPRHVLITGASGHLGRAVSAAFAAQGARLSLLDRHPHTAPANALHLAADLLDPAATEAAVARAVQAHGPVQVLCHLAGGFAMGDAVHQTPAQTLERLLDLNLRSLMHIAAAVVPGMQSAGAGHIVTVGAMGAQRGGALMGAYAASKSALQRVTESMSAELKDQGVHVNCVLPSIIDTPDNRAAMPEADPTQWVAPDALADVIVFLCSPAARAVHGASLPVTGRV